MVQRTDPRIREARALRFSLFRPWGLLSTTLLTCPACAPEFEENLSLVLGDQVLAVRAEPAEAAEGAPIVLRALHSGGGEVDFYSCLERKPISELGPVHPSCLDTEGEALSLLGSGESVDMVVAPDACALFGPRRPEPEPGQPAGRPADPDLTGGFYQPIIARGDDQASTLGVVRLICGLQRADRAQVIEYNQRFVPNTNVEVGQLQARQDGEWRALDAEEGPLRFQPGAVLELRITWAKCDDEPAQEQATGCTGAEPYVVFDPEARALVERTETIIASWFATAGDFENHRTKQHSSTASRNRWSAPQEPGLVEHWVVLRDGRGGVGWRRVVVEIE